jgi:hypothetical protein
MQRWEETVHTLVVMHDWERPEQLEKVTSQRRRALRVADYRIKGVM